jgi:hypothetical protein
MNYYKLQFNKTSKAYHLFFVAVSVNYGVDLWRPDETSVILFATPDSSEDVMKKLDVSEDCLAIGLGDSSDLHKNLTTAHVDDADLPDVAKQWLVEQIKTRTRIDELTKAPLGPGYRPLTQT